MTFIIFSYYAILWCIVIAAILITFATQRVDRETQRMLFASLLFLVAAMVIHVIAKALQ